MKFELIGSALTAPYLTLTQPDLLEFAPSAGDSFGVQAHQFRVSLRDHDSVFEDVDLSVDIIDCVVIDLFANEPQPPTPVSRVDLTKEISYVIGADFMKTVEYEFADFETNLNNGCESGFVTEHELIVDGVNGVPAWLHEFDPLAKHMVISTIDASTVGAHTIEVIARINTLPVNKQSATKVTFNLLIDMD